MPLTAAEIQHICHLLLHEDHKNVTLAKTLLESCYREALPKMRDQAILYTLFYPEDEQVGAWAVECFGAEAVEGHPIRPLAVAYGIFTQGKPHAEKQWQAFPYSMQEVMVCWPVWKGVEEFIADHMERRFAFGAVYEALKYKHGALPFPSLTIYLLEKATATLGDDDHSYWYPWIATLVKTLVASTAEHQLTPDLIQQVEKLYHRLYVIYPSGASLYHCGHFFETIVKDNVLAGQYYEKGAKQFPAHQVFKEALRRLSHLD